MYEKKGCSILIVEDSEEDFALLQRIFRKLNIEQRIRRCADGDEALELLRQGESCPADGQRARPTLILLDLNLPGTDGREVLRQVKSDPELRTIPVIVMTSSSDPREVARCYRDGASSYILKAIDPDEFLEDVQSLSRFWFQTALLPVQEPASAMEEARPCL